MARSRPFAEIRPNPCKLLGLRSSAPTSRDFQVPPQQGSSDDPCKGNP
jgi:hypothetical protein